MEVEKSGRGRCRWKEERGVCFWKFLAVLVCFEYVIVEGVLKKHVFLEQPKKGHPHKPNNTIDF